jgi:hypothetical protein
MVLGFIPLSLRRWLVKLHGEELWREVFQAAVSGGPATAGGGEQPGEQSQQLDASLVSLGPACPVADHTFFRCVGRGAAGDQAGASQGAHSRATGPFD